MLFHDDLIEEINLWTHQELKEYPWQNVRG
jgi:hypothetical protein